MQQIKAVRMGVRTAGRARLTLRSGGREPGDGVQDKSMVRLLEERAKVVLGPPRLTHWGFPMLHVASEWDTVGEGAVGAVAWGLSCGVCSGVPAV